MFDTPEETLQAIADLGVPEVFREIWQNREPRQLKYHFSAPSHFLRIKKELATAIPAVAHYIPLLERNGEAIYAFDTRSKIYVEHYYEDADARKIAPDYQQLIGFIFADFGFSGLDSIAEELAGIFEFKFMSQFREWMKASDDLDAITSRERFVTGLLDPP